MLVNNIIALILAGGVLIDLAWASLHDLKTRTIPKTSVAVIYGLVSVYLLITGSDLTVASLCFMFTFVTFLCLWAISKGNFGIGDVLILSALGWMVADLALLKAFLLTLGVLTIPYGLFCYWYYRNEAKLHNKWVGGPYLYPYMPIVFFTTMVYLLIPSILLKLFS